jgi:hypothetical protein
MRKLDWKQDGCDLMEEAEVYYQEAMNTYSWGRKPQKHEVVYAFRAEESEPEVERQQPRNTYEDTIKALTAQLKVCGSFVRTSHWHCISGLRRI